MAQATISTLATGGVCWPMAEIEGHHQPEMHWIDADRGHHRHHDGHHQDDRRRRMQEHAEIRNNSSAARAPQYLLLVSPVMACAEGLRQLHFGEVRCRAAPRSPPAASPPRSARRRRSWPCAGAPVEFAVDYSPDEKCGDDRQPAPSVAVTMPPNIAPRMTMGRVKAHERFLEAPSRPAQWKRSSTGKL